jgi:hypothetical protein
MKKLDEVLRDRTTKRLDEATLKTPGANEDLTQLMEEARSDARPDDVAWFNVRMVKLINEDMLSDTRFKGTRPVYTDGGQVVGFFVMKSGGYAKVFLARDSRPFGPYLAVGSEFYLTLQVSTDRHHPDGSISMIVSEVPVNPSSVKVPV